MRAAPRVRTQSAAPVISVGNLAMGGRGKTPVTGYLAQLLVDAGEKPAILSRGYRRRMPEEGVVIVSDGDHLRADLDRSGDEPLMLARSIPGAAVLVGEIRTMAAAMAEHLLGCTVLLLDDGFQHVAMRRDVDIVLVTAEDLVGRRLPFGRLRSPVSALARADAVVVDAGTVESVEAALGVILVSGHTARFSLTRRLGAPCLIEPPRTRLEKPARVVAVAGIAHPERFTRALREDGWDVVRSLGFPDHHSFTRRDIQRMSTALHETGASALLTTEKDAVRLLPLRPLRMPLAAVPLLVSVEPSVAFREWVIARLKQARA